MKVKIGNTLYDTKVSGPILLILDQEERNALKTMEDQCFRFAVFPKGGLKPHDVIAFMGLTNKNKGIFVIKESK